MEPVMSSYIEEMFGLSGKTVAITGGGGVIAGGMAEAFLGAGANVVLWDIDEKSAEQARARLEKDSNAKDRVLASKVDAMSEASVKEAIDAAASRFGSLDILVNTAGGNRGKTAFLDADIAQFELILKLNLVAGLMVPTQAACRYWISKGIKGSVINMASMSSYVPLSGVWAYDAAKAGVLNLTMAAAKEFAPHGIRINAIAPGFFVGKQNKALLIDEKTGELTARGKEVTGRTPMGRFGEAGELDGAVLYLSSNKAAGFVTGICIPVDGGFLVDCV
jgi:NAD(P)-dependent dehydrogenase (short-subunit alcohol dehydrogenase family)